MMANVVFASNNIAHWPGSVAVSGQHDATRVPYAIGLPYGAYIDGPEFTPVVGDESWVHFRYKAQNDRYDSGTVMKIWDGNGNILLDIYKRNPNYSCDFTLYNGSQTVLNTFSLGSTNYTYDFQFLIDAFGVQFKLYRNGTLMLTQTLGSNTNRIAPGKISLGGGKSDSGYTYFSEIFVADDDTRLGRLNLLRPSAAGAYSEWDGILANLADSSTETGMNTLLPDKRVSASLSAYAGTDGISNVIAISTTTRGQNSPTQLNHFVRMSAVDYDGPVHGVDFSFDTELTDWTINPATSLPWTIADLAAIEVGFQSLA